MGCGQSKSVETKEIDPAQSNDLLKSAEADKSVGVNNSVERNDSSNGLMNSYNSDNKTLKSSKFKNSKKRKKGEPFTIRKIETESCDIIYIKIYANYFRTEYLIPIWFEKNVYIKFITKGKWRIDKNYEFTNSLGKPTSRNVGFNYGALLGRVGSGPSFVISPNEFTHQTKKAGPLYLRMNLPKNLKVNPEGTMEIKVFDGKLLTMEEINEKIGWKTKSLKYEISDASELENRVANEFNDLRMNPVLFYETKLKPIQNSIWTEDFLKKMKNDNNNNEIQPLSINNNGYISVNNYLALYFDTIYNKIQGRNINKYLEELQEQINVAVKNDLSCGNLINCKLTKKEKSSDICIQYLLDEKFRENIFSNEFKSISVNIYDNFFDDTFLVIFNIILYFIV